MCSWRKKICSSDPQWVAMLAELRRYQIRLCTMCTVAASASTLRNTTTSPSPITSTGRCKRQRSKIAFGRFRFQTFHFYRYWLLVYWTTVLLFSDGFFFSVIVNGEYHVINLSHLVCYVLQEKIAGNSRIHIQDLVWRGERQWHNSGYTWKSMEITQSLY